MEADADGAFDFDEFVDALGVATPLLAGEEDAIVALAFEESECVTDAERVAGFDVGAGVRDTESETVPDAHIVNVATRVVAIGVSVVVTHAVRVA